MKLTTTAFADGGVIPPEFAFGRIDPAMHVALSQNLNPDFAWTGAPAATRSWRSFCRRNGERAGEPRRISMDVGARRFRIVRARSRRPRPEFFCAAEKAVDQSIRVPEITRR